MDSKTTLRPSATLVLLRDRNGDIETLMLQKNKRINYGGSWVFPGGVIDESDRAKANRIFTGEGLESIARIAAARECMEEAGLAVNPRSFTAFAHWVTPKIRPKRYATWFFASDANALNQEVTIDNGEIIAARWFSPKHALKMQASGDLQLNGPSFVTLTELSEFSDSATALMHYKQRSVEHFEPRGFIDEHGFTSIYHGDHAYNLSEINHQSIETAASPQHRLYMYKEGGWRYVKTI